MKEKFKGFIEENDSILNSNSPFCDELDGQLPILLFFKLVFI
jgi:hypothetical protein